MANTEEALARWATEVTYEDLPEDVIRLMKTLVWVIGDCIVAGGTADGVPEVLEMVDSWGGSEEATVFVHGRKLPAHSAVLVNSTMARAYDICDFIVPGLHLGTSVVPVAFAMAEAIGGLNGKDFITALAVGCEVGARITQVSDLKGFDPSGVCAVFATTVVAGRILGLDPTEMREAMGLAFHRAGGSFQANTDGSLAVRLIQAFTSQNGIVCAQLASRGLTGGDNFFEGVSGFFQLYSGGIKNVEGLIGNLGEHWSIRSMGFKKHPSCGAAATATDATLEIIAEHTVDPSEVEEITLRMSEPNFRLVGHPFSIGPFPTVSGQFNASYCVANVLLRGTPTLEHFSPKSVTATEIAELTARITTFADAELTNSSNPVGAIVEVRMRDGRILTGTADTMVGKGDVDPLSRERLIDDYWTRSSFGGKPIDTADLTRFFELAEELDMVSDVSAMVKLLVGRD